MDTMEVGVTAEQRERAAGQAAARGAAGSTGTTGRDLRGYLRFLEEEHPDQLFHVTREVDPHFETTALLAKLERQQRFPVVIFDRVKGSPYPVVTNVHASFQRLAMSLGLSPDAGVREFTREYGRREDRPIPPETVATGSVKEVVLQGDEIDLYQLPLLTYHELDAGAYITAGITVMKDADTGS